MIKIARKRDVHTIEVDILTEKLGPSLYFLFILNQPHEIITIIINTWKQKR